MADDEVTDSGVEEEDQNVAPIPTPFSMEFSGAQDQDTGLVFVILDIYTVTGLTRLFHPPEFGEQMSNHWHNVSVKMKAKQPRKGGLIVAQTDLSKLDLGNVKDGGGGL